MTKTITLPSFSTLTKSLFSYSATFAGMAVGVNLGKDIADLLLQREILPSFANHHTYHVTGHLVGVVTGYIIGKKSGEGVVKIGQLAGRFLNSLNPNNCPVKWKTGLLSEQVKFVSKEIDRISANRILYLFSLYLAPLISMLTFRYIRPYNIDTLKKMKQFLEEELSITQKKIDHYQKMQWIKIASIACLGLACFIPNP